MQRLVSSSCVRAIAHSIGSMGAPGGSSGRRAAAHASSACGCEALDDLGTQLGADRRPRVVDVLDDPGRLTLVGVVVLPDDGAQPRSSISPAASWIAQNSVDRDQ